MAIPQENKQLKIETSPQVITSPDANFQIINHRSFFDRFGCYSIDGAIKYLSAEPNLRAEIKADFYDLEGEFIDSETKIVDFNEPGTTVAFFIAYSGIKRGEIQHHVLYPGTKQS